MEDVALPIAFALGFVSGFKHTVEPDHVVAVSTLLHREPHSLTLKRTRWQGFAVGAVHGLAGSGALLLLGMSCQFGLLQ